MKSARLIRVKPILVADLDNLRKEGQLLVRSLNPEAVWLTHQHEPWRPVTSSP